MKTIKLAAGELLSVNQLNRKGVLPENIVASAKEIVARVRAEGDAAVRDYCSRFDGVDLESFRLPQEQIDAALEGLDPTFVAALEKAAAEKGVPVVSAGIAGLTGWCKAIFPGETGPASLLAGEGDRPTPDEILGNLAPTVFLAASLQAALVLQILTGKPVRREALFFDLEDGTFTQVVLDRRP